MSDWAGAFAMQAKACRDLGSDLTARICDAFARVIRDDPGTLARQVRDWPGDPSYHADSVPLRLCGALQALVLTGQIAPLADATDLDILAIFQKYEAHFLEWIKHTPQTNEVGRSAFLITGASFLAGLSQARFDLLELGASAGLNLNFRFYSLEHIENLPKNAPEDSVILRPDWRTGRPPIRALPIGTARGVDINPLDARRDGLRLMAYIWPDQPQRLARMRAALKLAQTHPPIIDRADAADWLQAQLATPPAHGRLVYHTVAAQYFPAAARARIDAALQTAGAQATLDRPVAHLSMESDGAPNMALRLRYWAGDAMQDWDLGRAHAHAQWIDWQPKRIA